MTPKIQQRNKKVVIRASGCDIGYFTSCLVGRSIDATLAAKFNYLVYASQGKRIQSKILDHVARLLVKWRKMGNSMDKKTCGYVRITIIIFVRQIFYASVNVSLLGVFEFGDTRLTD